MTEETPTAQQIPEPEPEGGESRPRRLLRSRRDRMIAGVAGGLGDYFGVDPVIVRIGFGISLFFGGLGALAYLALALFVPDEEGGAPAFPRSRTLTIAGILVLIAIATPLAGFGIFHHGHLLGALWLIVPVGLAIAVYAVLRDRRAAITPLRVLGAVVLVSIAAVGLVALSVVAAFATATGHGLAIALLVVAGGAIIAAAALRGGARILIAPALALALGVGVASAADLNFRGGIGDRSYTPTAGRAIPNDGYRLGVGRLAIDLRALQWKSGTVHHLAAHLGAGELVVAVPSKVCVDANAHVGAGDSRVLGQQADGVDVDNDQNAGASAKPRLVLNASVDAGELRVVNDDDADLGDHDLFVGIPDQALRDASVRACAAR